MTTTKIENYCIDCKAVAQLDCDSRGHVVGTLGQPSTEQPRPEQAGGERNDKMYSKLSRQARQHVHFCMFCGQSGTELGNEQHSTLIAQRERLLAMLKQFVSPTQCYCYTYVNEDGSGSKKCGQCGARELITTIEQEGTR